MFHCSSDPKREERNLLARKRRDCDRRAGYAAPQLKIAIEHMPRLDAHWNCRAGFTWFSGRGARSARKMQLYADIRRGETPTVSNHLRVAPARRVRVCKRCALAWARRTPVACKPRKLRPCMHPRNICKYTYTSISGTWVQLTRLYMHMTA